MNNRSRKSLATILILLNTVSCDGDSSNQSGTPLNSIVYEDYGVQLCVTKAATNNSWTTVEEVKQLDCPKVGKDQLFFSLKDGIWKTNDLDKFIYLEDLNISGHYFNELDVSRLTNLKSLALETSFIRSIDLSQNTQLEHINISSTPISQLDLSANLKVKEIFATDEITNNRIYQAGVIAEIDELLEKEGLSHDLGSNIRNLDFDAFITAPIDVRLPTEASLEKISYKKSSQPISLENNDQLTEVAGIFTAQTLTGAVKLTHINALVSGESTLDLSESSGLEKLILESVDLTDIQLPENLAQANITSPITSITAPYGSKLSRLNLSSNTQDDGDSSFLALQLSHLPIIDLTLHQYSFSQNLDLSMLDSLQSLKLYNVDTNNELLLPDSVNKLVLDGLKSNTAIQPKDNIESLYVSNHAELCSFTEHYIFINLKQLTLSNCPNTSLDLQYISTLEQLSIISSQIVNLDFSKTPDLHTLSLAWNSYIEPLDLTPLKNGELRKSFTFLDVDMPDEDFRVIQNEAENIFEDVKVNR